MLYFYRPPDTPIRDQKAVGVSGCAPQLKIESFPSPLKFLASPNSGRSRPVPKYKTMTDLSDLNIVFPPLTNFREE